MSLIEHVFDILLAEDTITEICGPQIYPGNLPENPPFPFLEFQELDTDQIEDSDGSSGLAIGMIQFDALSAEKWESIDLIEAVRRVFTVPMYEDEIIQEVTVDAGPIDLDEKLKDSSGNKIFRRAIRLQFIYGNNPD